MNTDDPVGEMGDIF